MTGRYVIGYDIGTSGVKAVLAGVDGRVVGSTTTPYRLVTGPNGWVEQHLDEILAALDATTNQLLSSSGAAAADIDGIGVTAQMFNLQPVDGACLPVLPMISWLDLRSTGQAQRLADRMSPDEQFELLGSTVTAKDIIPKILWLRDERPDLWRRTAKLLDCKEAVVASLTGASVIDITGASAMRLVDESVASWSHAACSALGIPLDRLPRIALATSMAGGLLPGPAQRMGLLAGTPVGVGAGDVPATQIGAGATEPGDAHLSLGTSGYWGITLAAPLSDPARRLGVLGHVNPDRWILWLEIATAGGALAWFLRLLGASAPSADEVDRLVLAVDDDVPLFAPWLSGERAPVFDDQIRGAFVELDLHHGLGHLLRAIMEGVAFQIRRALAYAEAYGAPVTEIRMVGGGSMSEAWLAIIADVLGRPIMAMQDPQDAGARGAVACLLVGLGHEFDVAFAKGGAVIEKTYRPTAAAADRYARRYAQFEQLYERLDQAHGAIRQ